MAKAAEAFRTISEVASDLDVPKHVLRFWEAKFPQIRPMKRGGGRRYYRPEDLELLKGIRRLLHAEGYTIKGVQKILREQGVDQVKMFAHVAAAEKSNGRGRGKPEAAAVASVGVAKATSKVRSQAGTQPVGGLDRAKPAPVSLESLLQSAIVELDACRRLLLGETVTVEHARQSRALGG